jgi:hypothetical protein
MSLLPQTQFTEWTDYGYSSFYKRYVSGLRAIAQRRYKLSGEEAEALAHSFIAEQSLVESGGLLASFDRSRHFRRYVVTAFLNHCRRGLKGGATPDPLDDELQAPESDDPAYNLLAEEAERLRQRVRQAVEVARSSLLKQGALTPPERAYLELKWPSDAGQPPLSDREVGERLQAQELVQSTSPAGLVRATCRIGDRVGTRLLAHLRGLLEEEYRKTLPPGDILRETSLSLNAIVHVLQLEER